MSQKKSAVLMLLALGSTCLMVGCGPAKQDLYEEIDANQTAFVINLDDSGADGQARLQSVEYLQERQVATRRIPIPQKARSIGRGWWSYEWIPNVKVIKVDRSPVTREWTDSPDSGTSTRNEALPVESADSINFCLGATLTASITEEDAAKFQYHFAGKPLEQIVDQNIRGFVQGGLAERFGKLDLVEGKLKKGEFFSEVFLEVREKFAAKGVTIEYFGSVKGLLYDDPKIQDAINAKFVAEQDIETAKKEKLAQDERNLLLIAKAEAERDAAQAYAEAEEAVRLKNELEIARINADAHKTAAEKWSGQVPSGILPQGSQMLFGLDAPSTANGSR